MKLVLSLCLTLFSLFTFGQNRFEGTVEDERGPVAFAKITLKELGRYAITDMDGAFVFENLPEGTVEMKIITSEHQILVQTVSIPSNERMKYELKRFAQNVDEIVITGTLKEVSKKESTVNVEVFSPKFFRKNPTPSVYDGLQNVNGVRPQLNCNICNTGDIHINGLEGPYTMVLIDGMPIVSSLSTVYGLSGIPSSLVERIEIVKGPSSTLYGSEAIGGIINIITKNPSNAPLFYGDVHTTSWLETNVDVGFKVGIGDRNKGKYDSPLSTAVYRKPIVDILTGINYFNYDWKQDHNNDGFTDVTLQDRISIFQKWKFNRKDNREFSLAGRYMYEDRWGGELNWTPAFRGGDSIYGESIYTSRWELIGKYQLPLKERVFLSTSFNGHNQNSFYGNTSFMADQFIGFGQLHWDKRIGKHDLLLGGATRYSRYDDNTPATEVTDAGDTRNLINETIITGAFLQDEIRFSRNHKLLLGLRYDYNSVHGSILTPRLGYKMAFKGDNIIRFNAGTGYRVVNIFTEDHAALTGARTVVIADGIAPEQSYNANLNYNKNFLVGEGSVIGLDLTAFYTYFTNRIVADYDQNPDEIFYGNLNGHAVSQGISGNINIRIKRNLSILLGGTLMDIGLIENGVKEQQILTERFTSTWTVSYEIPNINLSIDYTGNLYSPMRLPLLGELDPRSEYSPWWSIQNIQLTYDGFDNWEIYGGVKNLLNWTPNKNTPFLVARSHDPFDENVVFDNDGNALQTAENPYALTFDPSYVYAPNQGIRGFIGVRYTLKN